MKWYNISYFIREAVSSIGKHRVMSLAAVGVIAACLLIMGSFMMVAVNVESMLREIEAQNEILAYVNDTMDDEDAAEMGDRVRAASEEITEVIYISKADALETFREELGDDSDLLDGLEGDNPLRNRYCVKIKDISKTQEVADALKKVDGIADVSARSDVSDKIVQIRHLATLTCIIIVLVLLCVALFIISNTVNLALFNRREEIAIMKMIGANDSFVRSPFMIEGLILGIIGALLALVLQWILYTYIIKTTLADFALFELISFRSMFWYLLGSFVGIGALVGGIGSGFTIRKFLKV